MGDHEGWAQPSGLHPNGLLPNEAASVNRVLDPERWSKAEERTAELIACIQPNKPSEERRNAVADYVQRLIMKCFSCQVFTFGSVPLKTYLPDGDIDLTAFSKNQSLKDTWANKVRDMLENEEKNENAEFHVKEVQYIQAEVKIIKCLVENIVVDISFNQLGGLCTLCFLEEVDHLISQNHLFKRSIILIKAWCYYESRILGAHHGLISTYALETLVLYIFHVFNNSFTGPLEVLYRFLEFFSNFDWENFCVSLWGPVLITSLPAITAESPRKDTEELLLSKLFLDACRLVYAVFPGGQENQCQPFVSKHFNVIDPLRTNNNLGRSVSKGNFFRIRSAFAFGTRRLARLLDCPKENLIVEVNQFFMNTWERHGNGQRPDAPSADLCRLRSLNSDHVDGSENFNNYSSSKKKKEKSSGLESEALRNRTFHGISSQDSNHPSESMSRTSNTSAISHTRSQRNYANITSSRVPDQVAQHISPSENVRTDKGQRSRPDYLMNEEQGRYNFVRTQSSPELTDTSSEVTSRGKHNRVPETGKNHTASFRSDYSRRRNLGSEVSGTHSARSSTNVPSSMRHGSSHQSLNCTADSNIASNKHHDEAGLGAMRELASVAESMDVHQEEQDLVNMMASSRLHSFGGKIPINLTSPHLLLPTSPSVLASMGYTQNNLAGIVPSNIPLIEPPWGSNMQFPRGIVSSPLPHYLPSVGLASSPEEVIELSNENSGLTEVNQEEGDLGFWHGQDAGSTRGFDPNNGGFQMIQLDDKQQSTSLGFNFVPLSWMSSSGSSFVRGQHRFAKENRSLVSEDHSDTFQYPNNIGNEVCSSDRNSCLRVLPNSQASTSISKVSSESSQDGLSVKVSKSAMQKWGRRVSPSAVPSTVHGKGKSGRQYDGASLDHGSSQADDNNRDWIPLSTMGSEMAERSIGPASVGSPHTQGHQIPSYEPTEMRGSNSMIPLASMPVGSGSRPRTVDNSGVVPFAFYLTGPPVPFLTMLPVYDLPSETGNSEASSRHLDREEVLDNGCINQSDQNFDSPESLDRSEICEEHKSDILNSDFASHWQNLQYGRFCQNPESHGPLIYPSPAMVPPVYLQGHFPWDGPGRPVSANANLFTQLTNYGPGFIPIVPLQPGSNRSAGVYQHYGDDVPRYRDGTGTYLPNPKVFREHQSSNARNHKGNYNDDQNDHHRDKEGNWNSNSRPRASRRNHSRGQAGRPSSRSIRLAASDGRADSSWDSYRNDSFPSYQSPFGSSNSMRSDSSNVAYDMYPLPTMNGNGIASTGPSAPSVVMLYPYDRNVGPARFPTLSEDSQLGEGGPAWGVHDQQKFQGGSPAHSSPDQPSSPQLQRGI